MFLEAEFLLLSAGSDGQDGPTDAAGAFFLSSDLSVDTEMQTRAEQSLHNCDSYSFWHNFRQGTRHIRCGPTGTNVMDLQMLLFHFPYL